MNMILPVPHLEVNNTQHFMWHQKGKAFVSKFFLQLPSLVSDKKKYEDAISEVETGSAAKTYFRNLRDKFTERTQDEIIELIFGSAKAYAPAGIAIILKLVGIT